MSIYYLSNEGLDTNDGLSPENPWKTIPKANEAMNGGDELRLRRGDVFYGRINPKAGADREHPTTYSFYGEGEKPIVSQYKKAIPGAWEFDSEKGLWRLDLTDTEKFTGNIFNINTNVGFMKIDGKIFARKKYDFANLELEWDFINDDKFVWVKTPADPSGLAKSIEFACNIGCVGFCDNLKVVGIIFNGTGGHGISGVVNGAYIADCEFHEIGGSELPGYPTPGTRYGNGVECWANSSDVTVERCRFSGIYDVAITMQGRPVKKSWTNMHFNDNVMWNCQQCFEIWSAGDVPDTGFVDCWFERNVCVDSGYCWGYDVRPNKDCSSHLLIYGLGCPRCEIIVRNNVFKNARKATLYKSGGPKDVPADYQIYDNVIIIPKGQDIAYACGNDPETVKEFNEKIAASNRVVVEEY